MSESASNQERQMEIVKPHKVDFNKLMQQPEQYIILLTESQYMKLERNCEKAINSRLLNGKSPLAKLAAYVLDITLRQNFKCNCFPYNSHFAIYFKKGNDTARDDLIKAIIKGDKA